MKTKTKNIWRIIGVIIAVALLMYWLFAGTIIEEDTDGNFTPEVISPGIE